MAFFTHDGDEKAPSGKEMISEMLTKAHDAMKNAAGPVMDHAAKLCGDQKIEDPDRQREVLWHNLFNTPFGKADPIREIMSTKIKAALRCYNEQWHAWRKEIKDLAVQISWASDHQNPSTMSGRVDKKDTEEAVKQHPFQPKLSFD